MKWRLKNWEVKTLREAHVFLSSFGIMLLGLAIVTIFSKRWKLMAILILIGFTSLGIDKKIYKELEKKEDVSSIIPY